MGAAGRLCTAAWSRVGYFARVKEGIIAGVMAFGGRCDPRDACRYDGAGSFEQAHDYAGIITVAGFLIAFVLTNLEG